MRMDVSLLREHGHISVSQYPVHKVWEETYFITSRINARIASEALLTNMAILAALDKKASKDFTKQIRGLING